MRKSKSLNFLLELLLVIILFTFCSIVFVNLFVSASKMNKSTDTKYQASIEVESIAEQIRTNGTYQINENESYEIEVTSDDDTYTIIAKDNDGNVLEEVQVMYVE